MDDILYLQKQQKQLDKYEGLCVRCVECCGVYDGDPCTNLAKDDQSKYFCKIYDNRSGTQKTISGKSFNCVPIRDLIELDLPYSKCPYTQSKEGVYRES